MWLSLSRDELYNKIISLHNPDRLYHFQDLAQEYNETELKCAILAQLKMIGVSVATGEPMPKPVYRKIKPKISMPPKYEVVRALGPKAKKNQEKKRKKKQRAMDSYNKKVKQFEKMERRYLDI